MEGYVQGALRKELIVNTPFLEPLKQLLWESIFANVYRYFEKNA